MKPYGKSWNDFERDGLIRPGTVIIIEPITHYDGGIFLIGHINALRGECDDCTAFRDDQIVASYDDSLVDTVEKITGKKGALKR